VLIRPPYLICVTAPVSKANSKVLKEEKYTTLIDLEVKVMIHASTETYLLSTKNIRKSFGSVTVLHDINLNIRHGEIHAILGANGAGKSTLNKIIDGVYTDYSGEIYLNGELVRPQNTDDARLLGIGMVHQELSLVNELNVAENIYLNRFPKNRFGFINFKKMHQDSRRILDELGMEIPTTKIVSELSIADKQMIEIAKMLSMNAKLILLDEPTSALSDKEVQRLYITMENLKKRGKGIIFNTHKLDEIFASSDRVTILRDGLLIETIELNKQKDAKIEAQMIASMTGTEEDELGALYPEKENEIGDVVFEVKNFTGKGFKNCSFQLCKGEILGLSGLKGAGRTELARAIFGADPKIDGEMILEGKRIHIKHPKQAISQGIGMVSEDRKKEGVVGLLGVKENINLITIRDVLKNGLINKKLETNRSEEYIAKLNIKTNSVETLVSTLSGGNQQKVVLSKWLTTNCKVLIFDEPTRGIDVKAKSEIYKIMSDLAKEGLAILFISSEFPEMIAMSDRVLVMNGGKIVNELAKEDITKENIITSIFRENPEEVKVS